jgi:translation initiation factor 1
MAEQRWNIDRGQPLGAGRPPPASKSTARSLPGHPADGWIRVSRETKGRKGKGVTLVSGLRMGPEQLEELCRALKQRCGAGGGVKSGIIEVQGDHRETVLAELQARGFKAKLAGG